MSKTVSLVIIGFLILSIEMMNGCVGKPVVWFDGRIGITLDKVKRANVLPPDIVEERSSSSPRKSRTPTEGHDYVCVYLTIARIENVHLVNPVGFGEEKSILLDAESHKYELVDCLVEPVILIDPEHFATSDFEVEQGATGIIVFEVPKHEKPVELRLVYSFKATWEEKTEKKGQINISLLG